MLSKKDIERKISLANFTVFDSIGESSLIIGTRKIISILALLSFFVLFLPWTQNTSGYGKVTTVDAVQRPQQINAQIDAKIKRWLVTEGENVQAGDTLLQLEEIKEYYLDKELLNRYRSLIELKKESIVSYNDKVAALGDLIATLEKNRTIKLNQARLKLNSSMLKYKNDSAMYEAEKNGFQVAEEQYIRAQNMKEKGMIAQYDFENRTVKFREAKAKLLSSFNKIQSSQYDITIAENELQNISNSFNEKLAKSKSDRYSASISLLDAKNELVKLENKLANLEERSTMYYVVAPQSGFISNALSSGIGEVVKKGQTLLKIVPSYQNLAAEIYIRPLDVPLLRKGQEVRLVFDGWPSIVFSGWPGASVGTFSAEIYSIDRNISSNGKYRVLVTQRADQHWPELLQVGGGVQAYALLSDVPIWYELWRQLNGFPANFYIEENEDEKGYK